MEIYSQFAEQKHEQKMKEMELQAKAQGLGAASPHHAKQPKQR